jgi:hypothetical protein
MSQSADRKNIMAGNPVPQHNPTDGLGVAAYVNLSGGTGLSALTNHAGGSLAHGSSNAALNGVKNGQGIGATEGAAGSVSTAPGFPVAQYAITLSLSGAAGYETTAVLTAGLVDVQNNVYTPVSDFTAHSYNDPAAGSPAWYNPSNFAGYNANVVSAAAGSSGDATITLTAIANGQGIVEVAFPVFDNTLGTDSQGQQAPVNFIYVQVVVTVIT